MAMAQKDPKGTLDYMRLAEANEQRKEDADLWMKFYRSDREVIEVYRQRWRKALDDCEALHKSRDKWRETACSAIVVAIVLAVVLLVGRCTF